MTGPSHHRRQLARRPHREPIPQLGTLRQELSAIEIFLDLRPGPRPLDRNRAWSFARVLAGIGGDP